MTWLDEVKARSEDMPRLLAMIEILARKVEETDNLCPPTKIGECKRPLGEECYKCWIEWAEEESR